jgi:hypothetical protein
VKDRLTKKPPGEHVAIRQRAPITARWIIDVPATYRHRSFSRSGILRVADDTLGIGILTPTLAHLGLGRALALSGETGKAVAAYRDFFALWSNTDSDIPALKLAKAEYSKLKRPVDAD